MSYAIIRNTKYKRENLTGIYRHNERRNIQIVKLILERLGKTEDLIEYVEECTYWNTDELLEITPENIRIRKKILDARIRKREKFQ